MIDDLSTWEKWVPGVKRTMRRSPSPWRKSSGTGAHDLEGTKNGKGSMEVENAEPISVIELEAVFNKRCFRIEFTISFQRRNGRTRYACRLEGYGRTRRGGFAKILGRHVTQVDGKKILKPH